MTSHPSKTGTTLQLRDTPYWWARSVEDRVLEGNRITPLIDGEETFRAIHEAMATARRYVLITSWALDPGFPLLRPGETWDDQSTLYNVLQQLGRRGVHTYILLWDGFFGAQGKKPTAEEMGAMLGDMGESPTVHFVLAESPSTGSSHHQKTVVVDGRVAFCGGFDFSFMFFDRWDTPDHPAHDPRRNLEHDYWVDKWMTRFNKVPPNDGWHDIHAQVEGPVARSVEENFRERWDLARQKRQLLVDAQHNYAKSYATAHGVPFPADPPQVEWPQIPSADLGAGVCVGNQTGQIVRTMPETDELSVREIYLQAIKNARRYIYIENQYLNDPDLKDALVEALQKAKERKEKDGSEFRVVILLPSGYEKMADWDPFVYGDLQWEEFSEALRDAAADEATYNLYALYQQVGDQPKARSIYVHAKIMIVDDIWFTIGSTNTGVRSFTKDSELNVATVDADIASVRELDVALAEGRTSSAMDFRLRLWAEHLEMSPDAAALRDPIAGADLMLAAAQHNAKGKGAAQGRVHFMEAEVAEEARQWTFTPVKDESFVKDLDGAKARRLAELHAPYLHFHKEEKYFPIAVDAALQHSKLQKWGLVWNSNVKDAPLTGADLLTKDDLKHHVNLADAVKKRGELHQDRAIYYRAFEQSKSGTTYVVLQYWLFYLDSIGDYSENIKLRPSHHEGDWEFFQIVLDASEQPLSIGLSTHYYGDVADWSESRVQKVDGTHPRVYVVKGGHGCYLQEGKFLTYSDAKARFQRAGGAGNLGTGLDQTGSATELKPGDYELIDVTQQAWLPWKGRYGASSSAGPKCPRGPMYRSPDLDKDGSEQSMWHFPLTWQEEFDQPEYENTPR